MGSMINQILIFVGYSSDAKEEALSIRTLTSHLQKYLDNINLCSSHPRYNKVKVFNWDYDANLGIGGQKHAVDPYIESANIAIFVFKERVGSVTWEELTSFRDREHDEKIPVFALFPAEPPDSSKFNEADFAANWADLLNRRKELTSGWSDPFSKSVTPVQPYDDIPHLKALSLQILEDLIVSIVAAHKEQPITEAHELDEIGKQESFFDFDSQTDIFEYDSRAVDRYRELLRGEVKLRLPDSLSSGEFLREAGYLRGGNLTIAGVLLFSKQPSKFISSALTRCVKYSGIDKTFPRNRRDLIGPLLDQIREFPENKLPRQRINDDIPFRQ